MTTYQRGDRVEKLKGYHFIGTVRCVYTLTGGPREDQTRLDIMSDDGIVHILAPEQIQMVDGFARAAETKPQQGE